MPAENLKAKITLDQLFPDIVGVPALPLNGLSADSRRLQRGDLFLACQGATAHGLDFIEQATAAGVAAVAWDSSTAGAVESRVPMIAVPNLASRIGAVANRWFDAPSSKMRVAGVTGTNGKTTVAYLIAQSLARLKERCGYVGTLGSGIGEIENGGYMTTPACVELHGLFADYVEQGAGFAAIEVSSHALQQKRVDGVFFDVAIFTNLTRDHIDYHGSMQAYGESKASLFLDHDVANRIVNIDSAFGQSLAKRCGANVITISTDVDKPAAGRPHIIARDVVGTASGSRITFVSSWGEGQIRLPLPGDFNVANALDVLATLLCWDIPLADACAVLESAAAPPGRMQRVSVAGDEPLPAVLVDYSHTPDSLEAALKALRAHGDGRLWCVFGCGGDRDRGKRPMMGAVASQHADFAVLTSDNPRSEPPEQIIAEVLEGMGAGAIAITDRAAAIRHAIRHAEVGDIVLIAGKGHEHYQIIGSERIRFSDYDTAAACLAERREAIRT